MSIQFRLPVIVVALSFCMFSCGCDLGTYGARVADREAEMRDPSLRKTEEEVDTTTEYEYFHQMYIGFYTTNQRTPNSWQDVEQFAAQSGPRAANASDAMRRLNSGGFQGNWTLNPADSTINNLEGQTILYKSDGSSKVLYNGTVIP